MPWRSSIGCGQLRSAQVGKSRAKVSPEQRTLGLVTEQWSPEGWSPEIMGTLVGAWSARGRLHFRSVRFPGLRTTSELVALVLALVGLAFAVQVGAFPRPSSVQLLTANVLKTLLRYPVMRATAQLDGHAASSVCLNERVTIRGDRHRPLASLVLVNGAQRYFDVGHGIRQLGGVGLPYPVVRARFLLAACPALLAQRLGARLSRRGPISPRLTRVDGVPALEFEFGRAGSRVDLFVQRHTLRPVWLALSGQGVASDLEPTASSEPVEPALQSAFKLRVRFV